MLARHAAGLEEQNRTDFGLPADPPRRLRKLARLAVLGGACLLMAQGHFRSYKGADVLPLLTSSCADWTEFLEHTRRLYITPVETTSAEVDNYTAKLVLWLQWIDNQLATERPPNFLGFSHSTTQARSRFVWGRAFCCPQVLAAHRDRKVTSA
jgi:hypothetical protein